MSRLVNKQYAHPAIIQDGPAGFVFGMGPTVPPANELGWAPGAFFIDDDAGAGAQWYRNDGTVSAANFVAVLGGLDLSTLAATATELNRMAQLSTRSVALTPTVGAQTIPLTLASHSDKLLHITTSTLSFVISLPAMTGSGARYKISLDATLSSATVTISGTAAHLFGGIVQNNDTGSAGLFGAGVVTNAAGSTNITINGGTQGGRKGDWVMIEDVASSIGLVSGMLNASGTEATPFS